MNPLWTREEAGERLRMVWVRWARKQPDIDQHPNWLTPWEDLPERDKQIDMRMAHELICATLYRLGPRQGMDVYSHDNIRGYFTTGYRRPCRQIEGCTGEQLHVTWDDGKTSWCCTKGMVVDIDGIWRIA